MEFSNIFSAIQLGHSPETKCLRDGSYSHSVPVQPLTVCDIVIMLELHLRFKSHYFLSLSLLLQIFSLLI